MRCSIQWRGRVLRLILGADPVQIGVEVEGSSELMIAVVDGPSCRGRPGRRYVVGREGSGWGAWREAER